MEPTTCFVSGIPADRHKDTCGFELIADGNDQQVAQARFVVTGGTEERETGVTLSAKLHIDRWYDLTGVFEPRGINRGVISLYVADPGSGQLIAPPVSQEVSFARLSKSGSQNLLFFVAPSFRNGPQPCAQMDLAAVWHVALKSEEIKWLSAQTTDNIPSVPVPEETLQRLDDSIVKLVEEVRAGRKALESVPKALFGLRKTPSETVIFQRGDIRSPGKSVRPAGLSAVRNLDAELDVRNASSEGERRLKFAYWVTNPANPLTARVIVNRVWHHHFGVGIVDTPSDFGVNGRSPQSS